MFHKLLALLLFAAVSLAAQAEVYKWVDEAGKVHYGDAPADNIKKRAKKIDLQGAPPSDAQRAEAQARAAREKNYVDLLNQQKAQSAAQNEAAPQEEKASSDPKVQCEAARKRYAASQECFAPYRNATGGIKVEAFEQCTDVKEPPPC